MMLGYKGLSDKAPYEITGPTMTRINLRLKFFNLTNRFQVSVRLFSNRSQMTSKCGKNKKVAHEVQPSVSLLCNRSQMMSKCGKNKKVAREVQPSVSLMFLPHFDVLCDLLLNRRTAT